MNIKAAFMERGRRPLDRRGMGRKREVVVHRTRACHQLARVSDARGVVSPSSIR